jgi:twitching motility two-component system response regulator PilG
MPDLKEGTNVALRRRRMNSSTVTGTAAALRHGVIAAQAREFDRARELLQQVTEQTPDDVLGWYWLAIASPSADAAIPCLRRVLTIDGDHGPAREALSRLLLAEARTAAQAGRRDEARSMAMEASTFTPDSAAPWQTLAEVATTQGERIDALRRLVALSPDSDALRNQLRRALLARAVIIASSDRAEARSRFREAAALDPNDPRTWQALCNLADTRDEQTQCLRSLLRVAPDHSQGRRKLRQVLMDAARELLAADQRDESRDCWREAIEVAGGDVELWQGLAEATTDSNEAERALQSAYELDPRDLRTLDALQRLRGQETDPTALPAPEEAFARFEAAGDAADASALDGEMVDDSLLEALGQMPEPPARERPRVENDSTIDRATAHDAVIEIATIDTAATDIAPIETAAVETATFETVTTDTVTIETAPIETAPIESAPIETATNYTAPIESAPIDTATNDLTTTDTAAIEAAPTPSAIAAPEVATSVDALPAAEPPQADAAEPVATATEDQATVMVVDDSPTIRKILGLTLERAGYRVVAEANGESALARLQDLVPRVILLDIAMPGLDGYEVCKRIKQDPRTTAVPVIMLSGKGAFFDKVKGHMAGATEYLTKPFETPAVLAVVTSHCQRAAEAHHG